jgi:hypothetical protein
MGTAPAMIPVTTVLAFRTPPGGVSIPAGHSKQLGIVDVATFDQIRVVADERVGSGSGINIRLTITEGNELVAQLGSAFDTACAGDESLRRAWHETDGIC